MLSVSLELLADLGGWPLLKEARALVSGGRVVQARREGDTLRGSVKAADKVFHAEIRMAELVSKIDVKCSCFDFRRSGTVCIHIMAVGAAQLPSPAPSNLAIASTAIPRHEPPAQQGPKRLLLAEAPAGTPAVYLRLLLPLQLPDCLRQESLRVILEARREEVDTAGGGPQESRPWAAAMAEAGEAFGVLERDDQLLAALSKMTGPFAVNQGVAMVPRSGYQTLLHSLAEHPDIWLGKKQLIRVKALRELPILLVRNATDGSLELIAESPASAHSHNQSGTEVSVPGGRWFFDGTLLTERMSNAALFSRRIARSQIPAFITQEWPTLAANYEIRAESTSLASYQLEIGTPRFLVKMDGALTGLTLEMVGQYSGESFSLSARGPAGEDSAYHPDPQNNTRFWRRDFTAEQAALKQVEKAGFRPGRSPGLYTMSTENLVTDFIANVLPLWKRKWQVEYGPRLESILKDVVLAEPEFTLRPGGSGEDWLSLDLKLTTGGRPIPLEPHEIQRWLQTGRNRGNLPGKRTLLIPTTMWAEMQEVLAESSVKQEPGSSMQIPRAFAPFLSSALIAQGFRGQDLTGSEEGAPDVADGLPAELWAQLRPYQQEGASWLAQLTHRRMNGLLADDMGLGKTVQALVFASWLLQNRKNGPHGQGGPVLVVCPTSLVINWQREAARFVPKLRCTYLTGMDRAERVDRRHNYDLLITSYAILRRDADLYAQDHYSLVILDEAQHIKNRSSQNAQAAKSLKTDHRLILTGTPLENSILDLWSLFDFLQPGYLGTAKEFQERYENPLSKGQPDLKLMERLRHRVRPFFLRRTKEQVLSELPPRLEHVSLCELTSEQRQVYRAILAQGRKDVFNTSGKAGSGKNRLAVLTTLLRLRQVCCHLDMLPGGEQPSKWTEPSSKLDRTFELIDEAIDGGHRVLLFSQFVRALHLLRDEAQKRDVSFCYLDGETVKRQEEVDRFQKETSIPLFLISLKAGGTGLNLTGADVVIHFDPWWNPAVEEQATARAHRLGQARTVQSYKLIAAGTVEEKIQALQARKRELFMASVGGDEVLADHLSGQELEELLAD